MEGLEFPIIPSFKKATIHQKYMIIGFKVKRQKRKMYNTNPQNTKTMLYTIQSHFLLLRKVLWFDTAGFRSCLHEEGSIWADSIGKVVCHIIFIIRYFEGYLRCCFL
jgi:hypothetical protein